MMLRSVIFGFFLLLCAEMVVAQQDDWGVWTTVDIEKKLNKSWNAAAGLEYRSQDGLSLTDQIRGSLGAEYNPFSLFIMTYEENLISNSYCS